MVCCNWHCKSEYVIEGKLNEKELYGSLFYSCSIDKLNASQFETDTFYINYIRNRFQKSLIGGIVTLNNGDFPDYDSLDLNKIIEAMVPPPCCRININLHWINMDSIIKVTAPSFFNSYKNPYYFFYVSIVDSNNVLSYDCALKHNTNYYPEYFNKFSEDEKKYVRKVFGKPFLIAVKKNCNYLFYPTRLYNQTDNIIFLGLDTSLLSYQSSLTNLFNIWYIYSSVYVYKQGYSKMLADGNLGENFIPFIHILTGSDFKNTQIKFLNSKGYKYKYSIINTSNMKSKIFSLDVESIKTSSPK